MWQAAIVILLSSLVNVPRWFEFEYAEVPVVSDDDNGTTEVNATQMVARPTALR